MYENGETTTGPGGDEVDRRAGTLPGRPAGAGGGVVADDVAAIDRTQAALGDVDRALRRLDDGTYGTCAVCAGPLDDALLAARPATQLCPAHTDTA